MIRALEGYSATQNSEAVDPVPTRVNVEATKLSRSQLVTKATHRATPFIGSVNTGNPEGT